MDKRRNFKRNPHSTRFFVLTTRHFGPNRAYFSCYKTEPCTTWITLKIYSPCPRSDAVVSLCSITLTMQGLGRRSVMCLCNERNSHCSPPARWRARPALTRTFTLFGCSATYTHTPSIRATTALLSSLLTW